MNDDTTRKTFNEMIDSWSDRQERSHRNLCERFANAILQNCKWFISNMTVRDLMTIPWHIANFRCLISEGDQSLYYRNANVIHDWELHHFGFCVDEYDNPTFILQKKHVMLSIKIFHGGNVSIKYKAVCMGEDEWRELASNKESFNMFFEFCSWWMSNKSAYEIRKELEESI